MTLTICRQIVVYLALGWSISGCTKPVPNEVPDSQYINTIEFDFSTLKTRAPRSDNWAVTWASDGHQYTTWGDGGGFGGDNELGRVSMGIGKLEGDFNDFTAFNIWGGYNSKTKATFKGKSYGLLDIEGRLWMWKTGNSSDNSAYKEQSLYYSVDGGESWKRTGVDFRPGDSRDGQAFFAPTFLQFGPGYKRARDDYVYIYAPEVRNEEWEVQSPGSISLLRVKVDSMHKKRRYEYFSGLDDQGQPQWTQNINHRKDVFSHPAGVMRTSVNWNEGLGRYFLVTQMVSRFKKSNGHIGIFESCEPWGPWRTVLFENAWKTGLQKGAKTVFWNFSNRWTSDDGKHFALVYTGPGADEFGALRGSFGIDETYRSCEPVE